MEETAQTTHNFIYFVVLLILLVFITLMVFIGNLQELFSKAAEFFTPPSSQERPEEDTGEVSYFSLPITEDNTFLEKLRIFFEEFNVDYRKDEYQGSHTYYYYDSNYYQRQGSFNYNLWAYHPFLFDTGGESFSSPHELIKIAIENGVKIFNETNLNYDIKKVHFTEPGLHIQFKEDIRLDIVKDNSLSYSRDCWDTYRSRDFFNFPGNFIDGLFHKGFYERGGENYSGVILYKGDGSFDRFEGVVKMNVILVSFDFEPNVLHPVITMCDDNT